MAKTKVLNVVYILPSTSETLLLVPTLSWDEQFQMYEESKSLTAYITLHHNASAVITVQKTDPRGITLVTSANAYMISRMLVRSQVAV